MHMFAKDQYFSWFIFWYYFAGDMKACADNVKCSVRILEHNYTEGSIELAHEYHKLSEILCNTKAFSDALSYASKARTIFSKQYFDNHPLVREVDILCQQIASVKM